LDDDGAVLGEPPEEEVAETEGYWTKVKAWTYSRCLYEALKTGDADDDSYESSPDEDELPVDKAEVK
jgi:hypothetical protein